MFFVLNAPVERLGAAYDKSGYLNNWWTDDTWDKFHRGLYCMQEDFKAVKVNCLAVIRGRFFSVR
jgi:predicted metalloendopeptidase